MVCKNYVFRTEDYVLLQTLIVLKNREIFLFNFIPAFNLNVKVKKIHVYIHEVKMKGLTLASVLSST